MPILALLILFWAGTAHSESPQLIPAFTAKYKVLRNGLTIGKSSITLKNKANGEFNYESITEAAGILAWLFRKDRVREYSRGVFLKDGIQPLEYRYENTAKGPDRTEQVAFNWNTGKVRQTIRKPTWEIKLPPGTLDKATMKLALMVDLSLNRQDVTYSIADDAKLRHYRFHIIGKETITTPAGVFKTVKIERIRDKKRRSTTLWCAPELHYLPVKIEQREEDNTVFRSLLKKYSPALRIQPKG